MQGTVAKKVGRVMADLIQHPQYIPRCLAHNLVQSRTPLELELPWFSYLAIDFLQDYLRPHMRAAEYGSGGSTLFFAQRVSSVLSIENNAFWHELVQRRLQDKHLANVTLKLCPFDARQPDDFEHSDYLNALPDENFDMIVIDGSEEWIPLRPICFERAEARVQPGGIIVVDDSWRYPELRRSNRARNWKVFQSVGPCRPGVTSTDIYFY